MKPSVWSFRSVLLLLGVVLAAGCDGTPDAPEAVEEVLVTAAATPPVAGAPMAQNIDVKSFPELRQGERSKYGLEKMTVNMLRGVTEARPYGQAIINLKRVMIGEEIPNSRARIIGIDPKAGLAIEILDTGERFYVRFP